MPLRGIRGAITVKQNSDKQILVATQQLLEKIVSKNAIDMEDIAGCIFSVTADLNKEFPALAARKLGWIYTPLLCTYEIKVPDSLKKCVRVLLLVNSEKKQSEIKHVYLGKAKKLRPDLASKNAGLYYIS